MLVSNSKTNLKVTFLWRCLFSIQWINWWIVYRYIWNCVFAIWFVLNFIANSTSRGWKILQDHSSSVPKLYPSAFPPVQTSHRVSVKLLRLSWWQFTGCYSGRRGRSCDRFLPLNRWRRDHVIFQWVLLSSLISIVYNITDCSITQFRMA